MVPRYTESGQGLPVLLLHGFPFSSLMWHPQLELAARCRLIVPDQRGFGDSPLVEPDGTPPSPSLDVIADDLAALLDHLGLEQVVLCGLSMGGYVSLAFARRYPARVAGIVQGGSRANADADAERRVRLERADLIERSSSTDVLLGDFAERLTGHATKATRPDVVAQLRGWIRNAAPQAVAWTLRAMAARPDSFDVLRGLDVPGLVIVGDEDALNPPSESHAIQAALNGSRLTLLPGVGHMCNLENPSDFNAAVASFLHGFRLDVL